MRDEPEDLSADMVGQFAADHWRLPVDRVRYAPIGAGSHNWVAESGGMPRWFVKIDASDGFAELARRLRTVTALQDSGLEFVLAPLPDMAGEPLRPVTPRWAMSVYPFLDGDRVGPGPWPAGFDLTPMARLLARLHAAPVPDFAPRWPDPGDVLPQRLADMLPDLDSPWTGGAQAENARATLRAARPGLDRLLQHFHELKGRLDKDSGPWVVTHGEPHSANVMQTRIGELRLIDWDSIRVAPPEREFRQSRVLKDDAAYTKLLGPGNRPYVREMFTVEWDLLEVRWYARRLHGPHSDGDDARRAVETLRYCTDIASNWPELDDADR
jgi:spectinomycin phosphotransferase